KKPTFFKHKPRMARLFSLLFFGAFSVFAQAPADTRAQQFVDYYEALINQALSRYYHGSSFMVGARVQIQQPTDTLAQAVEPADAGEPAESLNDLQNPDGLDALPGLPVLPEQMRPGSRSFFRLDAEQASSQAPTPVYRQELGIQTLTITVLVDTVYSPADVEFILELVRMVAKLDNKRGDRVEVRKTVFPRLDRALEDHRIRVEDTPHPADTVHLVPGEKVHPWALYWEELPSLLPLLLILVFLTIVVALVMRGFRSTRLPAELVQRLDALRAAPAPVEPEPKPLPPPNPEEEEEKQLESQRTLCLNAVIGDPAGATQMLRNWIDTDRSKGLGEAAMFIQTLDAKVLEVLKLHLPIQDIRAIQMQMDVQTMPEIADRLALLRTFMKDLHALRARNTGDSASVADIFGFLNQLSTPQLLHILKDEPVGIVGLALAQIPGERSGLILQQMDPSFRVQVLVAMGQIDTVPVQAYKDVASRLARKALEVSNMRFVSADGVQTVLDIVQGLGLAEQEEYLHSIAERDLALAGRLRRFYATFGELPSLPEPVLVKVLNTCDRDVLVSALVGTEAEYRENLLSSMPQRFRAAVESGIEGNGEQSPLEGERARKALLAIVRQELQNAGGRT
ncbi:MAG TPA: FliG C-terminal domain-containing protein, partial [Fibrobacteraceae bacterium]|nr:FliG C-terminal domain-containing protein [Fibrobacteraceae bacterium]